MIKTNLRCILPTVWIQYFLTTRMHCKKICYVIYTTVNNNPKAIFGRVLSDFGALKGLHAVARETVKGVT